MLEELYKYNEQGSFTFKPNENLAKACKAPDDKCGVYLVYGISNEVKSLIYIGSSGHIKNDGSIHVRTSGGGGIKARIVNGHHFNKEKRYICWPKQMLMNGITELEIHWVVTCDASFSDSPCFVEYSILQKYFNKYKRLPRWNFKF